jgi:uncharacterized protein
MFGEHHDIPHEFPEFKELIRRLFDSDPDFKQIYTQYHDLDNEILQIEQNVEPVSDAYAEDLKKKRVHLKDEIYSVLRRQIA